MIISHYYFSMLENETWALGMLGNCSITELTHQPNNDYFAELRNVGAGEMVHSIKYLLCKHEEKPEFRYPKFM